MAFIIGWLNESAKYPPTQLALWMKQNKSEKDPFSDPSYFLLLISFSYSTSSSLRSYTSFQEGLFKRYDLRGTAHWLRLNRALAFSLHMQMVFGLRRRRRTPWPMNEKRNSIGKLIRSLGGVSQLTIPRAKSTKNHHLTKPFVILNILFISFGMWMQHFHISANRTEPLGQYSKTVVSENEWCASFALRKRMKVDCQRESFYTHSFMYFLPKAKANFSPQLFSILISLAFQREPPDAFFHSGIKFVT